MRGPSEERGDSHNVKKNLFQPAWAQGTAVPGPVPFKSYSIIICNDYPREKNVNQAQHLRNVSKAHAQGLARAAPKLAVGAWLERKMGLHLAPSLSISDSRKTPQRTFTIYICSREKRELKHTPSLPSSTGGAERY
jgi:hypothetical protein